MSRSEYTGRYDDVRVTNEPLAQQYLNRRLGDDDLEDEAFAEMSERRVLELELRAERARAVQPATAASPSRIVASPTPPPGDATSGSLAA